MQTEFTREEVACIVTQLRAITISDEAIFDVCQQDGMLTAIITLRRPGWSADVPLPLVEAERPKRVVQEKKTTRKRKS